MKKPKRTKQESDLLSSGTCTSHTEAVEVSRAVVIAKLSGKVQADTPIYIGGTYYGEIVLVRDCDLRQCGCHGEGHVLVGMPLGQARFDPKETARFRNFTFEELIRKVDPIC
jgi:hypothetical protein